MPSKDEWVKLTSLRRSKHWKEPVQNLYSKSIGRWKKPEHKKRLKEFMSNPKAIELMKTLNYLNGNDNE